MAEVSNANQALYVVGLSLSSGFFVNKSEKYLDENAVKKWYKYQEEERKKIGAVRQSVNVVVDAGCARYFGLKIANNEAKRQITEAVLKADVEMKKIDITLKAEVEFVQLPGDSFTSGSMLDKLTGQIRTQILEVAIKKIEDKIKKNSDSGILPEGMKETLRKALERVKAVNVIGDEGINAQIDAMKERIGNDADISSLRDEILAMLDTTKSRFEGIDMMVKPTPGEPAPGEVYVQDVSIEDSDEPTTEPSKPKSRKASRFDVDIQI